MDYQNLVVDFAKRTKHNLDRIRQMKQGDETVYEVTQLINSMLGLLVFPKENFYENIPRIPIDELERKGWIIPKVIGSFPQVTDLRELIRYLRNAIAHFNLEFYNEGTDEIKGIMVWNYKKDSINWKAKLTIQELESITEKFLKLIIKE
jgi:hypothetical protein